MESEFRAASAVKSGHALSRFVTWNGPLGEGVARMSDPYAHDEYLIRRKILTIFGAKFHVYDSSGRVILFSRQKAFKLKEDIRVYSDESEAEERLIIKARQIIDFSAAYDVVEAASGSKIGALRRKGFSSIIRDSWEFLDQADQPIGTILEDSTAMALLRRFLTTLIPQSFHVKVGGADVAEYHQNFNPFVFKLRVRLYPGARERISPLLVLAGGILLAAVEARQG
jgi:hypothetical protein